MTAPAGLPRLLRGAASGRALSLAEHVAQHGPTPRVDDPERLIELVAAAGLRGCGGAAFPTAVKLDAGIPWWELELTFDGWMLYTEGLIEFWGLPPEGKALKIASTSRLCKRMQP